MTVSMKVGSKSLFKDGTILLATVLSVGFEATAVQTSEDIGAVEVRVELNGTTEVPVTVLFTYNDETAAGICNRPIASYTLL